MDIIGVIGFGLAGMIGITGFAIVITAVADLVARLSGRV